MCRAIRLAVQVVDATVPGQRRPWRPLRIRHVSLHRKGSSVRVTIRFGVRLGPCLECASGERVRDRPRSPRRHRAGWPVSVVVLNAERVAEGSARVSRTAESPNGARLAAPRAASWRAERQRGESRSSPSDDPARAPPATSPAVCQEGESRSRLRWGTRMSSTGEMIASAGRFWMRFG